MLAIQLSNMVNTHWTVVLLNGLWWKYVTEILNTAINKHASMSLNWTSFIFGMQNVFCSSAPWTHAVLKDQASLRTPNMGESLRHAVCSGHALIKPAGSTQDTAHCCHLSFFGVRLILWKRRLYSWVLILVHTQKDCMNGPTSLTTQLKTTDQIESSAICPNYQKSWEENQCISALWSMHNLNLKLILKIPKSIIALVIKPDSCRGTTGPTILEFMLNGCLTSLINNRLAKYTSNWASHHVITKTSGAGGWGRFHWLRWS